MIINFLLIKERMSIPNDFQILSIHAFIIGGTMANTPIALKVKTEINLN